MKVIDIINILKEQGISVKYFHRKDGGYIITNIGGISYKALLVMLLLENLLEQLYLQQEKRN